MISSGGCSADSAFEWQKLFRSPSTHLEAEYTAEWVELKVAVALSLRSDESRGGGVYVKQTYCASVLLRQIFSGVREVELRPHPGLPQ